MCILYTIFGVHVHIGVGVIVYSYVQGITRTSSGRMSKDKGSTLCFYVWVVGAATRKNIKHNEQKVYPLCLSAVQFTTHGRPSHR